MEVLTAILIGVGIVIFGGVVTKIATMRKNDDDDFENRIGVAGKLWDACCRKVKGGHGI